MNNKLSISIGERSRLDFRVADCEKTYHCKAYYDETEQTIKYRVMSAIYARRYYGEDKRFNTLMEVREYILEDSKKGVRNE